MQNSRIHSSNVLIGHVLSFFHEVANKLVCPFLLGCFSFDCWFVRILYIAPILVLCQMYVLQMFFSVCDFPMCSLWALTAWWWSQSTWTFKRWLDSPRECPSYDLAPGYHFSFILSIKETTKSIPNSRAGRNRFCLSMGPCYPHTGRKEIESSRLRTSLHIDLASWGHVKFIG